MNYSNIFCIGSRPRCQPKFDRSMIFDLAREEPLPQSGAFDVCIVGAGAVGITIADDLVGRGLRVLLLEAGGRKHEEAPARVPFNAAEAKAALDISRRNFRRFDAG